MDQHQNKSSAITGTPGPQTHQNSHGQVRPVLVHSTHSYLETFDQATRENQVEQAVQEHQGPSASSEIMSASGTSGGQHQHHPQSVQEANSAVQLDRDVQQSRKTADDGRQKASGNSRSSYSQNSQDEYPGVE